MKQIFAVLSFLVLTISLASAQRLPEIARPDNYKLTFTPDLENAKFEGMKPLDPPAEAIFRDHAERSRHRLPRGDSHQRRHTAKS